MQSVGTRLRDARVKKGYTLEEINSRTRISLKNLNAIEGDELTKISSPFTYRSFVRQIAETVGVDYDSLSLDVQTASSSMPEPLVPGQEDETVVRPYHFQPRPKPTFNWRTYATGGAAGVVVLLFGYLLWRNMGDKSTPASALPSSSQTVSQPESPAAMPTVAAQPVQAPQIAQSRPQSTPTAAPPVAAPAAPVPVPGTEQLLPPQTASLQTVSRSAERGPIHLELSAIEPTWLSIVSDGHETYNGVLNVSDTKILNGWDKARIRTANAGGVTVVFNGRALGLLGRRGQARTIVFTKGGYEVVQGVGNMEPPRVNRNGG